MANKHILIILDGYGIAEDKSVSAIDAAKKPYLDHLFATYPHGQLEASGLKVGLPAGQMGNSEVGHMNLGAGRIVYQDITRIDKAIADGDFFDNKVMVDAMNHAKKNGTKLHLLGLFSDGGVHASNTHLYALLELAKRQGLAKNQVCVHAFMDGRDTAPDSGIHYVKMFQAEAEKIGVGILASIVGRYYAMDRDNRWERVKLAYDLLVDGEGELITDPIEALQNSYDAGIKDEFINPINIDCGINTNLENGDSVIFYNFRSDRAREISKALTDADFNEFERENGALDLHYVTFARYHESFPYPVIFPKLNLQKTLGEVVSSAGLTQLRAAETEKYPHVTFFFSGGREAPFEGESRILVNSPKVATYDLQPEMSAPELAEKVATFINTEKPNLVILNFANPDMVGHTGIFEAAVAAIKAVDGCTKTVVEAALANDYTVQIIADHGNSDKLRNADGSPHTAHTTVPVPHLIIKEGFTGPIKNGKLGDVAPTILKLLGVNPPAEMTGEVLI